jgi:tellurite resistance-related uncharacterized protein
VTVTSDIELPSDSEYVRTTPTFTETTVPAGLLGRHRVADSAWAVLTVHAGSLDFVFDEPADHAGDSPGGDRPGTRERRRMEAGDRQVIPPRRLHHLEFDGPARFDVAFHRIAASES